MEAETITPGEHSVPRARKAPSRAKNSVRTRKPKRADRVKSVIVRFRITPEQERTVLAEYPDVRISMLARRRLLGKRVGSPELRVLALDILKNVKESEQMLRGLHSHLDSEAASHPFGRLLARETERLATVREQVSELFMLL